jgi:hypothetical protein
MIKIIITAKDKSGNWVELERFCKNVEQIVSILKQDKKVFSTFYPEFDKKTTIFTHHVIQ